jgi:hypothetical protein
MANQVTIFDTTGGAMTELGKVDVDALTGAWPRSGDPFAAPGTVKSILVRSAGNGEARAGSFTRQASQAAKPPRRDVADELALFNATPRRMETLLEATGAGAADARWMINGRAVANAGTIAVSRGDTITIAVKQGTHDLTFLNVAQAKSFFKLEMPGSPFAARPGSTAISTSPLPAGTVLATVTVRSDVAAQSRVTIRTGQQTATFTVQP